MIATLLVRRKGAQPGYERREDRMADSREIGPEKATIQGKWRILTLVKAKLRIRVRFVSAHRDSINAPS
jgi:hypothetical protein